MSSPNPPPFPAVPQRVIAYYRVSTKKQGDSGLGLEGQEVAVTAYVAATGAKLLAPPYREVESGRHSDRPELAKAIAHARRAHATLLIAKLDRLARNVHFISGLMESKVDFVACDMPTANRLTVHILAAVAEDEARAISERTKAALAAAKARGAKLGTDNLTPEGTRKGLAAATIARRSNAEAAYRDIAPMIRDMANAGASLNAIAKRLNDAGEVTRRGAQWTAMQVSRVLNATRRKTAAFDRVMTPPASPEAREADLREWASANNALDDAVSNVIGATS
jgi:DNA invertase Pin-like site-specific DNA recombinase